jgi:hypothetical protein
MIGRRRQEAMANELSRQACETYVEDIMGHMKQMEVNSLFFQFYPALFTDLLNRKRRFPMLPR